MNKSVSDFRIDIGEDEIKHRILNRDYPFPMPLTAEDVRCIAEKLREEDSGLSGKRIWERISIMASESKINPVLGLIEAAYSNYLMQKESGNEPDSLGELYNILGIAPDDTMSRTLIKKWLMQAYCGLHNSNYETPFSLDIMLIFYGKTKRLTEFIREISVNYNYYASDTDTPYDENGTIPNVVPNWIAELGNVGADYRPIDKTISFIKSPSDRIAPTNMPCQFPYSNIVGYPRTCSFYGIVSEKDTADTLAKYGQFAVIPIKISKISKQKIKMFDSWGLWGQIADMVENEIAENGETYGTAFRLTPDEWTQHIN